MRLRRSRFLSCLVRSMSERSLRARSPEVVGCVALFFSFIFFWDISPHLSIRYGWMT